MPSADDPIQIRPGFPAVVLGVAIPAGAVLLVLLGASRGALERTAADPVPPSWVAVLTLVVAVVLGRRALTQRATLDLDGLVSRNLSSTVRLDWSTVEELRCVHRPGLVFVEIHVRGSRRRLRLGPASRFAGAEAQAMESVLAAHPRAGALLVRDQP